MLLKFLKLSPYFLAMPFPNWKSALTAFPAETSGDQNTARFLTAFRVGSSVVARAAAFPEDEQVLILAHLPGKSTTLCLYHNF